MANVGYVALLLALVLAIYASVAALVGARRRMPELVMSARNAALAVTGLLTLAVAILVYLLIIGDFRTLYVAEVSNRAMPVFFRITALWGSQAGSLLFWSWLMSLFSGAVLLRKWGKMRTLMPYVIVVTQITLAFFVGLISGVWTLLAGPLGALGVTGTATLLSDMATINPFHQLGFTPADGNGLNPLLRHWGMIIHPPMLYLGFVSFVIPYAFAIAALATRQTGDLWIRATRRWTLIAWFFLSMGLLLGAWWAYGVLGWGGYWAWDPVDGHCLPALSDDSREAGHVQGVEHGSHYADLQLSHLRHLSHPQWCYFFGTYLRPIGYRAALPGLHRSHVHRVGRFAIRSAGFSQERKRVRLDALA